MSRINEFKCDSCRDSQPAEWNGEHWLPPKGWIDLHDFNTVNDIGHLCNICAKIVVAINLRSTKPGKRIEKALTKESK